MDVLVSGKPAAGWDRRALSRLTNQEAKRLTTLEGCGVRTENRLGHCRGRPGRGTSDVQLGRAPQVHPAKV